MRRVEQVLCVMVCVLLVVGGVTSWLFWWPAGLWYTLMLVAMVWVGSLELR